LCYRCCKNIVPVSKNVQKTLACFVLWSHFADPFDIKTVIIPVVVVLLVIGAVIGFLLLRRRNSPQTKLVPCIPFCSDSSTVELFKHWFCMVAVKLCEYFTKGNLDK